MKTTTLILGIMIALVIGGGAGYSFGKNQNNSDASTKELQNSIAMMNEQALAIQKMAEMMTSGGTAMQEMGIKYKDDAATSKGKDMETIGEKYMTEMMNASKTHSSMPQMQM